MLDIWEKMALYVDELCKTEGPPRDNGGGEIKIEMGHFHSGKNDCTIRMVWKMAKLMYSHVSYFIRYSQIWEHLLLIYRDEQVSICEEYEEYNFAQ